MGNPAKRAPGKPNTETSIQHFSHEHQLLLVNLETQPNLSMDSCAGCKLKPSKWVYACETCNFILHIPCSQMPKLINHPADPNHTLTLLAQPAYPTGLFRCDACGNDGDGFNYHCSTCGIDLHIICATMPLSLTHPTHPCPLNLVFSPHGSQDFSCDVCHHGDGSNHWVYRCNPCGFNSHLNCANYNSSSSPSTPSMSQHQARSLVHPQPQPQSPLYQQSQPQIPSAPPVSQHQTRSLVHPQPQPQGQLYQQSQLQIQSAPPVSQHQTRSLVHPQPQPQGPLYQQSQPQIPSAPSVSQHQTRSLVHPQSPFYQQSQPQSPFYQQSQPQSSSTPSVAHHRTRSLVLPQPQSSLYQQPQSQLYQQSQPQSPLYQQPQPQNPFYCQQSTQPAQASTAEHIYHQHSLQPARVSTAEQERQNFIRDYVAAQQADQARILSMLQSNNGVMDASQLQILYNNSATGAVIQQYSQSILGTNNSEINPMTQQYLQGMLGNGNQVDPNLLASIIGGNNGGGGFGVGQPFNQGFTQNRFGGGNGGGPNFLQKILGGGGAGGGTGSKGGSSILRVLFGGF